MFIRKPIDIRGKGNVPLLSGLAAYCTLAGGLTTGCSWHGKIDAEVDVV